MESGSGRTATGVHGDLMDRNVLAVVFDLDGTLADTIGLIVSSWNAAVEPVMRRKYSADEVIARFGPTEAEMLRRELPVEHHAAAIETFHRRYAQDHARLANV